MSLLELQALATSVRVAPRAPQPPVPVAALPRTCATMLTQVLVVPSWPETECPRRRFTGRRPA